MSRAVQRRLVECLALATMVGIVPAALNDSVRAAFPGGNGRIAYATLVGSQYKIATIAPDGSGQITISTTSTTDSHPSWSPDGSRIVYSSERDVWLMNADGSNPTNLTATDEPHDGGLQPDWAPDGSRIIYEHDQDVWTMAPDGSDRINLTATLATEAIERDPAYSPDGTKIVYVRDNDLWMMDADGGNPTPLGATPAILEKAPDWSPSGDMIVFQRGGEIWTMAPDGSNLQALITSAEGGGTHPSWSPDGTKIVFSSSGFGAQNGPDLIVMNADGSGATRIGGTPNVTDFEADWGLRPTNLDLSLTLADSPDPAHPGSPVTYTATVTNSSPESDARLVTLFGVLPARASFVSVSSSQGTCKKDRSAILCRLGTIGSGIHGVPGTATVSVVVTPNSTFDISFAAQITSSHAAPHPKHSATETTTVQPPPNTEPAAFLTWSVPDRLRDYDGDEIVDEELFNNPKGALIPFKMTLSACDSTPIGAIEEYSFEVTLPSGEVLEQRGGACEFPFRPPKEGTYDVKLMVTSALDGRQATLEQKVPFRDLFIVSLGDSIASGEGVPDRICDEGCHWGEKPKWQSARCHRSAESGPSRAALALEQADLTTSVTFVHLACSGAEIRNGILEPYAGIEPPADGSKLPPQAQVLNQLMKAWGNRKPDVVLVSGGANDAKFADAVKECLWPSRCHKDGKFVDGVRRLLSLLPGRYHDLDAKFDALGIPGRKVFLTEYPDPTRNEGGVFVECPRGLVFASEWEWAFKNVISPLNKHVRDGVNRDGHGWNLVGGIQDAFRTHGYCSSSRWVLQIPESLDRQGDAEGSFHPNSHGHVLYGQRIVSVVGPKLKG